MTAEDLNGLGTLFCLVVAIIIAKWYERRLKRDK